MYAARMSESDLKAQFALYGVETFHVGDVELRVPRVLTRSLEKKLRVIRQKLAETQNESSALMQRARDMDKDTALATEEAMDALRVDAERLEQTTWDLSKEGVEALSIDPVPGIDDMSLDALSMLMNALQKLPTDGLARELAKKFPTSGG